MKIRHEQYGIVEGVDRDINAGKWIKQEEGRYISFYADDGWSEVKEPTRVYVTDQAEILEGRRSAVADWISILPPNHYWRKTEAFWKVWYQLEKGTKPQS